MFALDIQQLVADLITGFFVTSYDVVQRNHALAVANALGLEKGMKFVATD
jgi:hypothetical protein